MKWIIIFLFSVTFTYCGPALEETQTLQREVLSLAYGCGPEYQKRIEREIRYQSSHLNKRQMLKSLQNMKQDINCQRTDR